MVGCCVARLLAGVPGVTVTLVDVDESRAPVAELSWYGDAPVSVELGGVFHSRRLAVRASQVGEVAAARRGRRTHAERLALALDLLRDPVFDVLLTGESRFEELPELMANLAEGHISALCRSIIYPESPQAEA
jgi:hypothetical protein